MVSINGSTTVFQVSYSGTSEDCDKGNVDEIDTNKQIIDLNEESTGESAFSPIPVFSRIHSVSVDTNGTMFCTCKHFEQLDLPCVHQASVATFCHQYANPSQPGFRGFTHHDILVHWWSNYMYYAYKSTTPLHMMHNFHKLAIKDINRPKLLRCNVNLSSIKLDEPEILLPAIQCIKNYPKNAISLSDFTNTPLTKSRIHLSQTDSEEIEDNILNNIANRLRDSTCASAGHL
jgi:hypothetical protein